MYLVTSNKLGVFQNFVAFLEYLNFLCYPTLLQSAAKQKQELPKKKVKNAKKKINLCEK